MFTKSFNLNAIQKDPFRPFFLLGVLGALVGAVPWVSFGWSQSTYPIDLHKSLMFGCFLLPFVVGFLSTAVPRFTETDYISKAELLGLGLGLIATWVFILMSVPLGEHLSILFSFAVLGTFFVKRFVRRKSNPPSSFMFIGLGIVLWSLGAIIHTLNELNVVQSSYLLSLARLLSFKGALLSLVIGVGGRLIPGILGWTEIVQAQRASYEQAKPFFRVVPKSYFILAILLLASFAMDSCGTWGYALRFLVLSYFGVFVWKLWTFPKARHYVSWSIWISCWMFALGELWVFVFPTWSAHASHLSFMGGFGLLTLSVASRVTLAHSGESLARETTDWRIIAISGLVFSALGMRVAAPVAHYALFLATAASIWITAVVFWLVVFIKPLLNPKP